jgi:hypothetical protein
MVLLSIIKREQLPPSQGFTLGRFEIAVIVVASVWLLFELSKFRDESFRKSWI